MTFIRVLNRGFLTISAGALTPFAAEAASTSPSSATVVLVSPLSIVKTDDLSFGNVSVGPVAGTVTIDPDSGLRSSTGGVTLLGGESLPAGFVGAAAGLNLVYIHLPAAPLTLKRSGGTETVKVTQFTMQGGQLRLYILKQPFPFRIGGTLAVPAKQRDGTYSATFNVTIDYF